MFHQNRIDLDRELHQHPQLLENLSHQPSNEFEMRIAEIASYCDVALHGDYSPLDLDHLCGILYKKLVEKRTSSIIQSRN